MSSFARPAQHQGGADGGDGDTAPERDAENSARLEEDFSRADLGIGVSYGIAELRMEDGHDCSDHNRSAEDDGGPVAARLSRLRFGRHPALIMLQGAH